MEREIPNDFIVDWQGSQEATVKVIIQRLVLGEIDDGKPMLIVFTGKSGTGKSYTSIKVQEWIYEKRGLNYVDWLQHNIVLSPLNYGNQIKEILRNPILKPIFTIQIDEGRFVVGAENWGTFINATIGHVNASARAVKVMATLMITQSLRDIDKRLRDSVDMQLICRKEEGKVFVKFRKFWIDDSDIEKPRLRYRVPVGTIKFPDGTKQRIKLTWRPKMIKRELWEPYEEMMVKEKGSIIDAKMDKLIEKMKKEAGETNVGKAEQIAERFFKDRALLLQFGRIQNGHWVPNEKTEVFGFKKEEMKAMRKSLNEKLKQEAIERVTKKPIVEV